jgi:hypothetical protein
MEGSPKNNLKCQKLLFLGKREQIFGDIVKDDMRSCLQLHCLLKSKDVSNFQFLKSDPGKMPLAELYLEGGLSM